MQETAKEVVANLLKDAYAESLKPTPIYNKIYTIINNVKREIEDNGLHVRK